MRQELDSPPPEDRRLAEALTVLGSPVRLALLRQVRVPRTLREIEVHAPEEGAHGTRQRRTLTRQAVREHLDRLVDIGVVVPREAERDYGPAVEYVLNHQTLFALSEEFRSLARLRPAPELRGATVDQASPPGAFELRGPCLVLVKGLEEGRTFPIPPPARGRAQWVIGRSRGADVALDFDPFVSTENALVSWEGGAHVLEDLLESRNGTLLNFQRLPRGERRPLAMGDLIGVGRSLLMFRA